MSSYEPFCPLDSCLCHPSLEEDLSLKIEVRDQTIWKSTPEI